MRVYEAIKLLVDTVYGHMFFVYGHGGTGKTYLWNTIISGVRSTGKIVLAVASSGLHLFCFLVVEQHIRGLKYRLMLMIPQLARLKKAHN